MIIICIIDALICGKIVDNFIKMKLIELLEKYLFRGFSHLKRGIGYSKLPEKMIYKAGRNIPDEEIPNIYTKLFMTAFNRHYKK